MWLGRKTNAGIIFRQLEILSMIPHLKKARFLMINQRKISDLVRAINWHKKDKGIEFRVERKLYRYLNHRVLPKAIVLGATVHFKD